MFSRNDENTRKIIFWYDVPANFKDDIASDSYDCCRILVCEKNEFAIKKIIEHEDVESNFLVYIPFEKPADSENWLLDILMYSEEYYADTVALTMRRLGLTNTDLRRVIERYAKFFDAESRTKKLGTYVEISDKMNGEDLKTGMMCVLVKAGSRSIESILTELVFDDTQHSKYAEICKYGFEDYLWDEICRYYNYEGDQKIEVLTKKFLFTALLEQKVEFDELPSFYKQFIIGDSGKMDAKFFIDRIKNDKRYVELQLGMAADLKIEGLLVSRDISCVQNADIFECIDSHIVKKISESLMNGSLDYDTFDRVISSRLSSMWYETHKAEYELLKAAMSFFRILEKPIPSKLLATEYVKKYVDEYYLVDTFYRRACANYKKIEAPLQEMELLMDRIELTYESKYLDAIGKEFSAALSEQGEWRFPGIQMTKELYRKIQSQNYKKCFVIISDGMRYEIGRELYERIKADAVLKGSEELLFAMSPLPSETRFGMAYLLPHQSISYFNKAVSIDGKPTNSIAARNVILNEKNKGYAAISYDDINSMSRNDLRAYMADKSLVYIYHNVIDSAGEHSETRVFDVVESAIEEILMLIRKLYNSLQISNFYVTADHGFLYRRNAVLESGKYSDIMSLKAPEASKRFVISDDPDMRIQYASEFNLDDVSNGEYKVIVPYSYGIFKTNGGGIQYVHGGASLQETIVPIIHISELSAAKNKDAMTPVGVRLKTITRKITNRSFTLEFEQYEKVGELKQAVNCETYLIDEDGNKVSGEYKFVAGSESDDPESRSIKIRFALMNIEFDRNKRYYLILKNISNPDEYIEKEQFTIDILQFKMF